MPLEHQTCSACNSHCTLLVQHPTPAAAVAADFGAGAVAAPVRAAGTPVAPAASRAALAESGFQAAVVIGLLPLHHPKKYAVTNQYQYMDQEQQKAEMLI